MLLRAGAEAGTLRADVEPEDVLRAMGAIWLVADGDDFAEQAMRILRLVLDGLRYRAPGQRSTPSAPDANMCSCHVKPRSSTPTSTRSSRRSSSATTRGCAASR